MRVVAGTVGAVVGAGLGYVAWLVLMWLYATVCDGILNWLACGGMGGPNVLDLLMLPIAVIGLAVLGYQTAADMATRGE